MTPRVRFAPSPTGYLHVGGARTALFNWLYARRHGGVFVLRIEDTDVERSSADMVTGILDGLRWLGLDWDEGPLVGGAHAPYFQSQRVDRHRAAAARLRQRRARVLLLLLRRTPARRARDGGGPRRGVAVRPGLPGACPPTSGRRWTPTGRPGRCGSRCAPGGTSFDDAVHGTITFDSANIEDFVILRSDGHPTYHLSVVVDDVDMAITHVIRGDDHISNTPKHVLLFEAMGAPVPRFAHVPLILGADKKRLSKRHGATSVMEYERQGYFSAAMVNFLALLGWSPGDDRELLSKTELIEAFSLEAISGGNAVFNTEKLDWMNGQYIGRMSADELSAALAPRLAEAGLGRCPHRAAIPIDSGGCSNCCGRAPSGSPTSSIRRSRCLWTTVEYSRRPSRSISPARTCRRSRRARCATRWPRSIRSTKQRRSRASCDTAAALGIKAGPLIHAARVAVTGRTNSPGLFEMLALLGRARRSSRLDRLEQFLLARA